MRNKKKKDFDTDIIKWVVLAVILEETFPLSLSKLLFIT
jgi:hypothetical protein